MKGLWRSAIRTCPALVFFIAFLTFCYSAMAQTPLGMAELASPLFAAITLFIGFVLAIVTLLTALTTVIRPGDESIAAMRAFGHSFPECRWAILEGTVRPHMWVLPPGASVSMPSLKSCFAFCGDAGDDPDL